jgi:protein-disulfide isomerase
VKSSEVKIFSIILVIALILVGLAIWPMMQPNTGVERTKPVPEPSLKRSDLVSPNTHIKGDEKAPTTIVVFSDFQCPSCKEAAPAVDIFLAERKGQVNCAFRHFQIKPEHKLARVLSRTVEAAGKQGKFWEMHDAVFQQQKEIVAAGSEDRAVSKVREIAKTIGLDMFKYDTAMAQKDDSQFEQDVKAGEKVKLSGTPTYFIIDPQGKVTRYNTIRLLREWADGEQKRSGSS